MFKHILFLSMFLSLVSANNYTVLGISIEGKVEPTKVPKKQVSTNEHIKITPIDEEKIATHETTLTKVLSHTKMEKISKEMTLYGMGMEYQLSDTVEVSLNLLTELDLKEPKKMLKDPVTNISVALSL